jgi:hypothetical protein
MLSSSYAFMAFFFLLFVFVWYKHRKLCAAQNFSPESCLGITFFFVFLLTCGMFAMNTALMSSRCKAVDFGVVAKATLPWPLLFGSTAAALEFLPSWKTPFANTFGYMIYNFAGKGNDLIKTLLKNDGHDSYKYVVEDPGLFANTIDLSNFKEQSEKSFHVQPVPLKALFDLIVLKHVTADFVWYMLVGSVVMTMSYNTILTAACSLKA